MNAADSQLTVGALVARYPMTRAVFERHQIDYCCGGQRSLGEASAARGVALEDLHQEIDRAIALAAVDTDEPSWEGSSSTAICRYIVERFHVPLREELQRLENLATRVVAAHGAERPEVISIQRVLRAFRGELEDHMAKEEQVLFLAIEQAERDGSVLGCGFEGPVRTMISEHEDAGEALANLRRLSNGFSPPDTACATFQALYDGLAHVESEMHRHVHLENEILFPRTLAMAANLQSSTVR
jgi:regulator of cell morphogenesis and NO signaling